MIVIYHKNNKVVSVFDSDKNQELSFVSSNLSLTVYEQAKVKPNNILVWCHIDNKSFIDLDYIVSQCSQSNIMLSFSKNDFMSSRIGYVEESPFLKVNKTVKYPTWLMSSLIGVMSSQSILAFEAILKSNTDFVYQLNVIAKIGMPKGLLCYSDPNLLLEGFPKQMEKEISNITFFKFVKQYYKWVWFYLLFFNILIFEKQFFVAPFFLSLFKRRKTKGLDFKRKKALNLNSNLLETYDVIIPTLGRAKYLLNVLRDLSNQTLLPLNVIIVEQNDIEKSVSELPYINNENWPFTIKHQLIQQTGACNARNLALKKITSNYVFFADDDIRFDKNVLEKSIVFLKSNKLKAITLSCRLKGEKEAFPVPIQWSSFGSGCSIVDSSILNSVQFNMAFEHGFGEDSDFGAQLREMGVDILYYPDVILNHIKAPVGGFRTLFKHPWEKGEIQPKPSPTVLLYKLLNETKYQLLGYKSILFFKYYRVQYVKNPFLYYKQFKKQWSVSLYWANLLKEENK